MVLSVTNASWSGPKLGPLHTRYESPPFCWVSAFELIANSAVSSVHGAPTAPLGRVKLFRTGVEGTGSTVG